MFLIPDSNGEDNAPLREYNQCHNPAGQPTGGQFCGRDAFVGLTRPTPLQRLLEPYSGEARSALQEMYRELIARTKADGNEHLAVKQPGKPIEYVTSGASNFVEMPRWNFLEELRANPPLVKAHTHPTDSAPSWQDLRMQVKARAPRAVVFAPNGSWYELEITDFAKAAKLVPSQAKDPGYFTKRQFSRLGSVWERDRKLASREAARVADAWLEKQVPGWKAAKSPEGFDGFSTPDGWVTRSEAGQRHPEIRAVHRKAFEELSPRIWIKLAENNADWLKFRYHRGTGPYATTTAVH